MRRLCLAFRIYVLIGFLYVLTEARVSNRRRGKLKLPDPSYLLIPGIYERYERRGQIYHGKPDQTWTTYSIANDGQRLSFYCPEVVETTIDLHREPVVLIHRKCDSSKLEAGNCLNGAKGGTHSYVCVNQGYYRKIRFNGTEMFQKTFAGCGCSATYVMAANDNSKV